MADIFISFAREDRHASWTLSQRLEECGLSVFDEAFIASSWREESARAISRCDVVVVIWSKIFADTCREICSAAEAADRPLLVAYAAGSFDESEPHLSKYSAYSFDALAPNGLGLLADAIVTSFDSAPSTTRIDDAYVAADEERDALPLVIDQERDADWNIVHWIARAVEETRIRKTQKVEVMARVHLRQTARQVRYISVARHGLVKQFATAGGGGARVIDRRPMTQTAARSHALSDVHGSLVAAYGDCQVMAAGEVVADLGSSFNFYGAASHYWPPRFAAPVGGAAKRLFDIIVSAAAIAILAPIILVVALLVRVDSAGPALFRQERGGFRRRSFRMWKFRTMTVTENRGVVQVRPSDARITRIGGFLRRTSLDELPQLFNVLMGDMSVVGPRPHAIEHDVIFETVDPRYAGRFRARPGVVGLAQVNGWQGPTETDEKIRGRTAYDIDYVQNWSFWLDMRILLRTAALYVEGG
jgi:lipopolysaccharide/colanic/teichoic acid biosynthesis glycosyltransferase